MGLTDEARRRAAESRRLARQDPLAWLEERLRPWGIDPLGPSSGEPCPPCEDAEEHACWPWIGGTRDDPSFSHCAGCHRTWRSAESAAHCQECHRHLGGDEAFDRHRARGRCRDPHALGMEVDNLGTWSLRGRASSAAAREPRGRINGGAQGHSKMCTPHHEGGT